MMVKVFYNHFWMFVFFYTDMFHVSWAALITSIWIAPSRRSRGKELNNNEFLHDKRSLFM